MSTPKFDQAAEMAVELIEQILAQQRRGGPSLVQYQYPDGGARAADGGPRGADGDGRLAGRVRSPRRPEGAAILLGDGHAGRAGGGRTDRPGSVAARVT